MEMKLYGHSLRELLLGIMKDAGVEVDSFAAAGEFEFSFQNHRFLVESGQEACKISRSEGSSRDDTLREASQDGQGFGDSLVYEHTHHTLIQLQRHLYYFFIHAERYEYILLQPASLRIRLYYAFPEKTLKASSSAKRVPARVELEELQSFMMNYKGGYVMNHEQGSVSIANRNRFVIQGYGYDFDPVQALRKALLEYLERCAATHELPGTVQGSYESLAEKGAVDPVLFGLYDIDLGNYSASFPLVKYSSKLDMHWVRARSLLTEKNYYVPEQLTQYLREGLLNPYIFESSNGCAIGNSFTEAAFYSILEVIERDLFMKCWFYEHPVQQIQFADDRVLNMKGKQLYFEELGYSLAFYYLANPMDIPAVWCLITSQDEKNVFYSVTGLGCHLHIEDAVEAAFFEAYKSFKELKEQDEAELEKKIRHIEQTQQINEVIEHIHYFLSYASSALLGKITSSAENIDITELSNISYEHQDLTAELNELLRRLKPYYSDVLIIDQGNSFLEAFGLCCTKALLAGAVPLDFTSNFIRKYAGDPENIKQAKRNIHPLA